MHHQDYLNESPLLVPFGPEISTIQWPGEDKRQYEVGVLDCTYIKAYSDGGIVWIEVGEGDFVRCRVPANQVAIYLESQRTNVLRGKRGKDNDQNI